MNAIIAVAPVVYARILASLLLMKCRFTRFLRSSR